MEAGNQVKIDHLLIAGFGGPEKPDDILPFLRHVTAGRNIPEPRIQAVAHQYEEIGGKSPYHEHVTEMKHLLESGLRARNITLPVYIGYRHWHPFMEDTAAAVAAAGLKKGLAFILAPFRSPSSCKRYKDAVRKAAETHGLEYTFTPGWGLEPKMIESIAETAAAARNAVPKEDLEKTAVIFSCHSIPVSMLAECSFCNYEKEVTEAAARTAAKAGISSWLIAYHSRSGNPRDPWLGPDIGDVVNTLPAETKRILVIPLGFICENAEILYDLDILTKNAAEKRGLIYMRADAVYRNALFIDMAADVIIRSLQESNGS